MLGGMTPEQRTAAELLLEWLAPADALDGGQDAVIGFGHFDLRIAARCAELWAAGQVARVIFTGGVGAGTADLGQPEADAFLAHVGRLHPGLPRERIVVENRSTNTGENIRFTLELLAREPAGRELRRVVLVANPSRQRRVMQTWRRLAPEIVAQAAPPATTLEEERRLFAAHGQDLLAQLAGEVERLRTYPERGWIEPIAVPDTVRRAAELCRVAVSDR
ncbi:MAG: YdcF family protein [Verrucomicrobia bacterium]|nr:YdcF family protein [Verrucomicrobiota bacterium]